jgi:hypothetical protein
MGDLPSSKSKSAGFHEVAKKQSVDPDLGDTHLETLLFDLHAQVPKFGCRFLADEL